jgi:hypothetical protein
MRDEAMQEPKATFNQAILTTKPGLIQWPDSSKSVSLSDFKNAEVLPRSFLKAHQDAVVEMQGNQTTTGDSHRVLVENSFGLKADRHEKFHAAFERFYSKLDAMELKVNENRRRLSKGGSCSFIADYKNKKSDKDAKEESLSEKELEMSRMQKTKRVWAVKSELERYFKLAEYLFIDSNTSSVSYAKYNSSDSCLHLTASLESFSGKISQIRTLIFGLDKLLGKINCTLYKVQEMEDYLTDIVELDTELKGAVIFIARVPYIGPFVRAFHASFHQEVSNIITPVRNRVRRLNRKIQETHLQARLVNVMKILVAFYQSKIISGFQYLDQVISTLIAADAICGIDPGTLIGDDYPKTTATTCHELTNFLDPINHLLDELINKLDFFSDLLSSLDDFLNSISRFMDHFDLGILDSLRSVFRAIQEFLTQILKICVKYPTFEIRKKCTTVRYPCGFKRSGWRIRTKWCHRDVCVEYPIAVWSEACIRFSIMDVVNGLLRVVSYLERALMSMVNDLLKAFKINLDFINFPGLPNLGIIDAIHDLLDDILDAMPNIDVDLGLSLDFINLENLFGDILEKLVDLLPKSCTAIAAHPTAQPTSRPSDAPSFSPTSPSGVPSAQPSVIPTAPSSSPSGVPTSPTSNPTLEPTSPSSSPSGEPTNVPTYSPTSPTGVPTEFPTSPSSNPTGQPSSQPTGEPTSFPSAVPSGVPTSLPTMPTSVPSSNPTAVVSDPPSAIPTPSPSAVPTPTPSTIPSTIPSLAPSSTPTEPPSPIPTIDPSAFPTSPPSVIPSLAPSSIPTAPPSPIPTPLPSVSPSVIPTFAPVLVATPSPTPVTHVPTCIPSPSPTINIPPLTPSPTAGTWSDFVSPVPRSGVKMSSNLVEGYGILFACTLALCAGLRLTQYLTRVAKPARRRRRDLPLSIGEVSIPPNPAMATTQRDDPPSPQDGDLNSWISSQQELDEKQREDDEELASVSSVEIV